DDGHADIGKSEVDDERLVARTGKRVDACTDVGGEVAGGGNPRKWRLLVRGEPGVRGRGHLGEPAPEGGSAPCRAQSARHLGELAEGAAERDLPVEVRAEAERDLPLVLLRARERRDRGNAEVGGEIERPYRSTHRGVSLDGACNVARAD